MLVAASNGTVVWSGAYDAFGNCEVGVETVESNLRLPGQYYDAETGLSYNLNRYYNPKIGRYLQPDPAGDGLNPYTYVGGNPVNAIDPEGLCAFRMFSGMTETFVGYGFVNSGVFLVPGTLMMINGMDEAVAGFRGLWTGQPSRSVLEHAMYSTIPNDTVASSVHFASQLAISASPVIGEFIGDVGQYARRTVLDDSGAAWFGWGKKASKKGIRNAKLAGKVHPKTKVPFDNQGFPNFKNYLYKGGANDVKITPTGSRYSDFDAANKAAGYQSTPKGYTWHHHQTKGRMQLVETFIHSKTGHTGGFDLW